MVKRMRYGMYMAVAGILAACLLYDALYTLEMAIERDAKAKHKKL